MVVSMKSRALSGGNPIEGEFIQSWDFIEEYFGQDWCTFSDPVLKMIRAMRKAGYDHVLRAGQSMRSLVLSRSRRHGQLMENAFLWFDFRDESMDVYARSAGQARFAQAELILKDQPLQFTKDVRRLADALVEVDIE